MEKSILRASMILAIGLVTFAGCGGRDKTMNPVGKLVAEGDGAVSYRAPRDGTIYVYDGEIERLVYSGPIREGQVFSVDPRNKRLMLDGSVIQDNALDSGRRHKIYLKDNEPDSESSSGSNRDRVILEQGTRTTEYRRSNEGR